VGLSPKQRIPIRIDDTVLKPDKAWAAQIADTRGIGDFRAWKDPGQYQKSFERLLRDLKAWRPRLAQTPALECLRSRRDLIS
jgi:hypothetical protein